MTAATSSSAAPSGIAPGPGLYAHIPFCPQICPYCAFAKVVDQPEEHARYIGAVCAELENATSRRPVSSEAFATVFFGGGTPSLLAPALLGELLETARRCQGIAGDAEITLEVNPGTVDEGKLSQLRDVGFNRLSIGVQAFDDAGLKALGRVHDVAAAEAAFAASRRAGFDNVSIDLISGGPGRSIETWERTVERAVELRPEHISAYALTIEEGTLFADRRRQGRLTLPSEEVEIHALVWTDRRLEASGYEHYEVSNFAQPGRRSRHNWGYWSGMKYLGVGVSAHSYYDNVRSWNHHDLALYLESMATEELPRAGHEVLDSTTQMCERIWLGLRTSAGVLLSSVEMKVLGASERMKQIRASGFLNLDGNRLYPTSAGFPLADALGLEVTAILESAIAEPAIRPRPANQYTPDHGTSLVAEDAATVPSAVEPGAENTWQNERIA